MLGSRLWLKVKSWQCPETQTWPPPSLTTCFSKPHSGHSAHWTASVSGSLGLAVAPKRGPQPRTIEETETQVPGNLQTPLPRIPPRELRSEGHQRYKSRSPAHLKAVASPCAGSSSPLPILGSRMGNPRPALLQGPPCPRHKRDRPDRGCARGRRERPAGQMRPHPLVNSTLKANKSGDHHQSPGGNGPGPFISALQFCPRKLQIGSLSVAQQGSFLVRTMNEPPGETIIRRVHETATAPEHV